MSTTYELKRLGFDQLMRHFQQIKPAIQHELERFRAEMAQEEAQAVRGSFDESIASRSGHTRDALEAWVGADAASATRAPVPDTIRWLDQGTGIYGPSGQPNHVKARGKPLHFEWHGQEYFRRGVNVKGIKPRRFIERGVQAFKSGRLPARLRELEQRLTHLAKTVG